MGWIGIKFDLEGEYKVDVNPLVCTFRIASHKAVRDSRHDPVFEITKNVLFVALPPARWELDAWWRKMPEVSDNPGTKRRRMVKMLGV